VLPLPGLDDEIGHALKVAEVVCDQGALGLQCRCGNEQIRIGEQGSLPMEVAIQRGGAVHHLIGEWEDEAGLAQEHKRRFLGPRLFGLEPAQQFIAGDDREGKSLVLSEVGPHPLQDERMLFEEFRKNIGVEDDGRLRL
jgi:hypothetical protein